MTTRQDLATMTVGELRDALEGYDDDAQVRLATQSAHPAEYTVFPEMAYVGPHGDDDFPQVVYIAEGELIGDLDERAAVHLADMDW
jgi:hypothetical protein